ncbi:ABC transporter substrate-binding protein [Nocardia elegans]|uniref:ABC transporter substrate-binding protein n=1 Tax=Nocardia nova TaxID=37330 RepID=A0A2T2Z2B6_9NOCA|nr:ABC transporter substrate-binding protein [Nocardia elegans]PSR61916.1 ABC transporter substrate-binding protein [Nocardia nova]
MAALLHGDPLTVAGRANTEGRVSVRLGARGYILRAACVIVGAAVLAAGCADNTEDESPKVPKVPVTKVESIAAQLPPKIARAGRLVVGVNVPYQPNEYRDPHTGQIIGFDVDLMDAVAAVLGVRADYQEADFEKIIPAIEAGTVDVGMSSFTDNLTREKTVDFVDYFSAGIQWAQRKGRPIDPNNACGKKVAVQRTTTEDIDEIPAKSKACADAGKPEIHKMSYDEQSAAATALVLGQVDAMSADSPVTAYAIKRNPDTIEAAGPVFEAEPYGWPVPKGSPLAPVLQAALQHLIDSGVYHTIAENWGVEAGAITTSVINGAKG